MHKLKPLI